MPNTKIHNVDVYLTIGCCRCPLGDTPQCKVHTWQAELAALRRLLLDCGLTEEVKWSIPCYTFQQNNILLLSAFNNYCALSFFKGALLCDTHNILITQTENTQSTRQIRFTDVREIIEKEAILKAYIFEAIEVEKAGLKVHLKEISEFAIPIEFEQKLAENPALKTAFEALTAGRQRGYLLYFSAPKQAKTRLLRIEKCMPQIVKGKGLHD